MTKSNLKVQGKREVQRAFSRLADSMGDLSDVNAELGSKLLDDVQNKTRRRTGTLRDSWIATGEPDRIAFNNPQKYAGVQEYGSEKLAIQPTNAVKLAFEDNTDAITDAYGDATRKRAKRANIRTTGN